LLEYIHDLKLSQNIISYTTLVRATITVGVKASSHGALLVGNHHGEVTNARKTAGTFCAAEIFFRQKSVRSESQPWKRLNATDN